MKIKKVLSKRVMSLFIFLCFTALIATQGIHAAAPIPAVTGPIPVTPDSYPFGAANRTSVPQDLSQAGYVEEEYFVSGLANVYDFDSDGKVIIKTADAPYKTRILVRRPVSAKKFSGTVIVELLNPTALYDLDIQWSISRDYFIAQRDAWVGISIKPVVLKALKNFDSQRYASLSMANPLPPDQTCPKPFSMLPDSTPATENGLVWDIVSQVGALLRSDSEQNPLRGFQVERVYATGYSQTGGYLVTYINFIHPLPTATLQTGKPVYDGYLIGDGDGLAPPLNQCAAPFKPGDPRVIIQPRPEPVISVVSQTLLGMSVPVRRADSDSPGDRYRRYEVPGAAHINKHEVNFWPGPEDTAKTGITAPPPHCKEVAQYGLTDFPFEYLMNGAFANLEAWVRHGRVPPKAPWIDIREVPGIPFPVAQLDQHGNAVGGLRIPYLDVPIATYYVTSTTDSPNKLYCLLAGYKVPFKKDVLTQLYPTHRSYVKKVRKAVKALVKARLITKNDGKKIKREAAKAAIP